MDGPGFRTENFPGTPADLAGRWGFIGKEAPENIAKLYLRRRVPEEMRRRGRSRPKGVHISASCSAPRPVSITPRSETSRGRCKRWAPHRAVCHHWERVRDLRTLTAP